MLDYPDLPRAACKLPEMTASHGRASDALFFPIERTGHRPQGGNGIRGETEAKQICGRCPEIEPCRRWVLTRERDTGITEYGVWAGLTDAERGAIHKSRRERSTRRSRVA